MAATRKRPSATQEGSKRPQTQTPRAAVEALPEEPVSGRMYGFGASQFPEPKGGYPVALRYVMPIPIGGGSVRLHWEAERAGARQLTIDVDVATAKSLLGSIGGALKMLEQMSKVG